MKRNYSIAVVMIAVSYLMSLDSTTAQSKTKSTLEEAKKAIAGLNNKEVGGRAMSVSVAKPKSDNKRW